jgi:hypothetical protein
MTSNRVIFPFQATIPIQFSPDMWVLVIEQSLMFLLVIGRWLLPKGQITRDQLSQLLFVYIGLASDIMELFVLFDEKKVLLHPFLSYIILGIWTMSLLQFVLVLTATKTRRKKVALIRPTAQEDPDELEGECAGCCGGKCCENEVWSILITVFLQDAPFLSLRLYAMITFQLFNYTILFFTVKNALVIVLQFYRLIVVTCLTDEDGGDDEENGSSGFDNKALINDDDAEVIDEKPWTRQPPPAGEMKRRSPVGAAAGVTAGNEGTAWGERFGRVDSPSLSKVSKQTSSLTSIASQPSLQGVPDAGNALVAAGSLVPPNTPGSVRLVRVASATSNITEPQATPSQGRGVVAVSGQRKPNSLPPLKTQPTPILVKVQPTPKVPPRKPKSPTSSAKVRPSSSMTLAKGGRGTTASSDIMTGVSNTPPLVDVSTNLAKESDGTTPAKDDVTLQDYEDTAMRIEDIENNMDTAIGADVAQQEPGMKATSGSDVMKSTGSEEISENDQPEKLFFPEVRDAEAGEVIEDIGDQELEELFVTAGGGEDTKLDGEGAVQVVETVGSVADDRKVQTVIELDGDKDGVAEISET